MVEPRKSIAFIWLCKARDNGFQRWMNDDKEHSPSSIAKGTFYSTAALICNRSQPSSLGPVSFYYCATPSQSRTLSLLSSQYLQPTNLCKCKSNQFIYLPENKFPNRYSQIRDLLYLSVQVQANEIPTLAHTLGQNNVETWTTTRLAEISLDEEMIRLTFTALGFALVT